jgi:hypothetical protein
MIWINATYFEVAEYWPEENDYGATHGCNSLEEAKVVAAELRRLGYRNVHIRKVTIERIEEELAEPGESNAKR